MQNENLNKDKDLIDDGFNAEFVQNAIFDGLLEIPLIKNPKEIVIPNIRFSDERTYKRIIPAEPPLALFET